MMKRRYRTPRPGEVLSYLNRHATHVELHQGLDVRFSPCPACHRDQRGGAGTSNTINTQTGLWFCWSCRAKGNFFTLTRAFGDPLPEADRYADDGSAEDLKKWAHGWQEMVKKGGESPRRPVINGHHPALLEYCLGRGISTETLDAFRVSTKGPETLRWPLYAWSDEDANWLMANARLRTVFDRDAKKANSQTVDWFELRGGDTNLMVGNHLLDLSGEPVAVITEGQWDAMTAYQIGMRNVFSLPNGASHVDVARMLRYIPETWEVWLCVDMDESGDRCSEAFFAQLGPDRLARIHMPAKDLNQWYQDTAFQLTPAMVQAQLKGWTHKAKTLGKPAATGARYLAIKPSAAAVKPQPMIDSPWPTITRLIDGGLKRRQTTGVLAPSGIGKTTFVNQWGVHCAAKGVKTGIISLEGDRDSISAKLAQVIEGYCGADRMDEVAKNLLVSPLEGSSVKWEQCLAEMKAMAEDGCEVLILDNLDFCMPRSSMMLANQQKVVAYGAIVDAARVWGVHIVVVWQPFKVEQGQIVNSGMQKGAAQTYQDADNYMNLNRIDGVGRIEVEKCRDMGQQKERYVWMAYDEERRCLFETGAAGGQGGQGSQGTARLTLVTGR